MALALDLLAKAHHPNAARRLADAATFAASARLSGRIDALDEAAGGVGHTLKIARTVIDGLGRAADAAVWLCRTSAVTDSAARLWPSSDALVWWAQLAPSALADRLREQQRP